MKARLIAYAIAVALGAAAAALLTEVISDSFIAETAGSRPIAYQTFAGTGAALMAVQLAMLAFFTVTSQGSRLRRVLVFSKGSGAASIGADTLASILTAIGFSMLIVAEPMNAELAFWIAGAFIAVQLVVGWKLARLSYLVMRSVEHDALEQARAEYLEAGRRFDSDPMPADA